MNYLDRFRVKPGDKVRLAGLDPAFTDSQDKNTKSDEQIDHYRSRLVELQEMLFVQRSCSLLICLQALDTGGKDGTIKHILGAMNPQGCTVHQFREPTREELDHDFLWRIHRATPARGQVVIFNRSHYEDVLVARVHGLMTRAIWSARYEQINAFERALFQQGTHILKFFLHISPQEQLARFKARLDDPSKHWKISLSDYEERKYWSQYEDAYEDAISSCSTDAAPWFVIPANRKWFRNLAVARIVVETLESMRLSYPKPGYRSGAPGLPESNQKLRPPPCPGPPPSARH